MRKLVPSSSEIPTYSAEVERDAYCHPAITSPLDLALLVEIGVLVRDRDDTRGVRDFLGADSDRVPDLYHNYHEMRKLVPSSSEIPTYSAEVERDAYCHPAITSQAPLLWVPRDPIGVLAHLVIVVVQVRAEELGEHVRLRCWR
jgi:hypothetical protein